MLGKRSLAIFAAAILVVIVAAGIACGDDDDGDATPTAQPSPTRTASLETPWDTDGKTPIAGETPGDTADGTPTNGTPRPTALAGTLAVAPDDQAAFLARFADKTIDYEDCQFDPATSATDCGENSTYRVDPVLTGQDVSCRVGLVDDAPVLINCTSQDPAQSIYYEIKS